jgi:hypothetical protein
MMNQAYPRGTYGTQGTPALNIISLLSLLLPIALIASGGGPINTIPASFTLRAKSVDSDMNPYPGWIASAPDWAAMARILSARNWDQLPSLMIAVDEEIARMKKGRRVDLKWEGRTYDSEEGAGPIQYASSAYHQLPAHHHTQNEGNIPPEHACSPYQLLNI